MNAIRLTDTQAVMIENNINGFVDLGVEPLPPPAFKKIKRQILKVREG